MVVGVLVGGAAGAAAIDDQLLASPPTAAPVYTATPSTPTAEPRRKRHRTVPESHVPAGTTVFADDVPGVAKLDRELLEALRGAASDAGIQFVVNSGWRSKAYQRGLLEEAVAWDQAFEDDREFGRKVRTLAGNFQLFARMPRLLFPIANPSWFETFSHKLLRLVCPWALLALLAATVSGAIIAPEVWLIRLLGLGQILLVVLALVGARGGRLAGVARTFVVLHVAAVVGLWRYLRGTQKVTW